MIHFYDPDVKLALGHDGSFVSRRNPSLYPSAASLHKSSKYCGYRALVAVCYESTKHTEAL